MALSGALSKAGSPPTRIETTAQVGLEKTADGFKIPNIHLQTKAKVPGLDDAKFQELAEQAKKNCPVSKVLAGAEITLEAKLEK
jgi:osmotically inducible protein OsmC